MLGKGRDGFKPEEGGISAQTFCFKIPPPLSSPRSFPPLSSSPRHLLLHLPPPAYLSNFDVPIHFDQTISPHTATCRSKRILRRVWNEKDRRYID